MHLIQKQAILKILPLIDLLLSPFVWVAGWILVFVRRVGIYRFPVIRRVFKSIGILPIRHHYYEPLCYQDEMRHSTEAVRSLPGLDLKESAQLALLNEFCYQDELLAYPLEKEANQPYYYKNNFYEAGDAEIYYNVIRHFKPQKIIEIGSGFSTYMAIDASQKNQSENPQHTCEITCIEPFEHPELEAMGVNVKRNKVETLDPAYFDQLSSDDILFIDSSHVIRPQGDVLYEILEVLGRLKPGVLVHIHDVFTPRDYRQGTLFEAQYFWNEQYLLEAFLSYNLNFEILLSVNHLHKSHSAALRNACPNLKSYDPDPCSFWIRRV